jgi:hypothetical protein
VIRPAVEALQRMGERSLGAVAVALLGETLYRQRKYDEAMLATLMSEDDQRPRRCGCANGLAGIARQDPSDPT